MAKYVGYKRPKDTKKTLKRMLHYMGIHKWSMALVAVLVCISSSANIFGTYLVKPVVNKYILSGDVPGLIRMLIFMGILYGAGVAATFGYGQLMSRTAQKVVAEIRSDLFSHVQKLPLTYFDAHTHGEMMSRFTNDVDTIQEALNNSFSMMIQSFLVLTGTVTMLMVLNVPLSLIVLFFLSCMFAFIKYNSKRSKRYFNEQQAAMGDIALHLHHTLGLEVYSRTDFLMDADGHFWCLEVNSLPGMTSASLVPKEAAAVGMSYNALCEEIVQQSYCLKRRT